MKSEPLTNSLRETLAIFDESKEPWTTPEVAESLGLGRRSTYARLERLVEHNKIKTKKVGANARVWWRSPTNADKAVPDWSAAAESLIDDVLGDVEVGIFVLDENFDIAWINGATERYFGLDREQVVGRDKHQLIDEHIARIVKDSGEFTETVLATYDDNTYTEHFECHVVSGDKHEGRWLEHRSKPIKSGEYAGGRVELYYDVTDLKQKEQQLEHQRTKLRSELNEVFDRINDAVCGLDGDWRFTYLNDRAEELVGKTEKELLGSHVWDAFSGDLHRSFIDYYEQAMETQTPVTFEEYSDAAEAWLEVTAYSSKSGLSVYFRDITERKERERALEESEQRYRTLVENFPNGAVAFLNHDLQHTIVGGQGFNNLDFNANDLQNKRMQEVYSEDVSEIIEPHYRAALDGTANSFELEVQGRTLEFRTIPLTTDDDDVFAAMAVSQDVTERKQYEERLQALYTSSRGFLTADTTPEISQILIETASDVLDLPGVVFYDYDAERDRLVPEKTSREADFMREEFPEVPSDDSSITGSVFSSGDPQYYENVLESPNLQMSPDATEMRAGLFVPLGTEGILTAGSRDVDGFDSSIRQLLELLATNAEIAYKRVDSKQELIHRNEQLTALNSLNKVIQEIMDAVINQSTREEIEATVCEHLADSDSYLFAWIGDADAATQTVNMRAKAGVEGDLDGITISVDPDDDRSKGPIGRAFRTGEIQTSQDLDSDSRYDPWRDQIESYGFRSSAAIPIIHEDTVYGVLSVYAERPFAFDGHEGELIAQLSEIIGHTIAATERKRALMSDELVELEFRIQNVAATLGIPAKMEGTITLDNAVPIGDDEFLVYGTATSDAIDTVTSLVETLPHWNAVTFHSEGTPTSFELKLTEPPILSIVASIGGNIKEVTIDDGNYQMTIHLAPSVDVHRVIDAVEKEYPQAEMIRRRQITRSHDDSQRLFRHLVSDLTDRQHATLDAAYHAGFFEWPRETSGEDVAESMGVAPPTFHQHLRKAERKVFDLVFSTTTYSTE
ncbi:bacterio-opsin activator domain-containing protein [Haladaptatus sp. DFWS20]|uniref:bacterio-opsin activator domain-containing protein n=1 Tax=Haladaptatus sp. DFWS20 TaxID=3403467 RepID=UPI003EB924C1